MGCQRMHRVHGGSDRDIFRDGAEFPDPGAGVHDRAARHHIGMLPDNPRPEQFPVQPASTGETMPEHLAFLTTVKEEYNCTNFHPAGTNKAHLQTTRINIQNISFFFRQPYRPGN